MPELPEVQTVVTQLGQKIVGKQIVGLWSDWQKKILPSYAVFTKQVKGASVLGVRRFGKHIVMDLDSQHSIVAHLKMTGHFLVKDDQNREAAAFTEDPINGYIHHVLTFADGTTLEFSDMRKFGWLHVMTTVEVEKLPSIATLGIDALSPQLTRKRFYELLHTKKTRPIGVVLLEQDLIAGIGNIYRSEALFLAGIVPTRPIGTLTPSEWQKILPAIKQVLEKAVHLRGTSDGDFRDTDGLQGSFQETLYVYGRTGEPCKKCGTIIVRQKIGQRSVFYCPRCQK
jgi:formamidopyrimidine-DNA glycosylase